MSTFPNPPYSAAYVASLFTHSASQRINQSWPRISFWLGKYDAATDEDLVIYTLATIRAETSARFPFSLDPEKPSAISQRIHEGKIRPFGQYDVLGTNAQRNLGNHAAPENREQMLRARHGDAPKTDDNDGFNFRGRGFVQLTGRWNYTDMQHKLAAYVPGIDLVNNPDQASELEIASQIIAIWVGVWKRPLILNAMQTKNYLAARQAVNSGGQNMEAFMEIVHAHNRKKQLFERLLQNSNQPIA